MFGQGKEAETAEVRKQKDGLEKTTSEETLILASEAFRKFRKEPNFQLKLP